MEAQALSSTIFLWVAVLCFWSTITIKLKRVNMKTHGLTGNSFLESFCNCYSALLALHGLPWRNDILGTNWFLCLYLSFLVSQWANKDTCRKIVDTVHDEIMRNCQNSWSWSSDGLNCSSLLKPHIYCHKILWLICFVSYPKCSTAQLRLPLHCLLYTRVRLYNFGLVLFCY